MDVRGEYLNNCDIQGQLSHVSILIPFHSDNEDITEVLNEQKIEVERLMGMLKMGKFSSPKDVEKLTTEVAALRQALQSTITSLTETGTETVSEVTSMIDDAEQTKIITVNLPVNLPKKIKKKKKSRIPTIQPSNRPTLKLEDVR